jgi:hypothetical protein
MSWAHVLTTPEFWTGAFVSGLLGSGFKYFSNRASDRRNAKQEKMQARKETREAKVREHECVRYGSPLSQFGANVVTDMPTERLVD